eukprot:g4858.t1
MDSSDSSVMASGAPAQGLPSAARCRVLQLIDGKERPLDEIAGGLFQGECSRTTILELAFPAAIGLEQPSIIGAPEPVQDGKGLKLSVKSGSRRADLVLEAWAGQTQLQFPKVPTSERKRPRVDPQTGTLKVYISKLSGTAKQITLVATWHFNGTALEPVQLPLQLGAAKKRKRACNWYDDAQVMLTSLNTVLHTLEEHRRASEPGFVIELDVGGPCLIPIGIDVTQNQLAIWKAREDLKTALNNVQQACDAAREALTMRSLSDQDEPVDTWGALAFFDGLFDDDDFQGALDQLLGGGEDAMDMGEGEGESESK